MNYYPRYPGDYLIKTLGLTMIEDGAYTRLLDWYYSNEEQIEHAKRYEVARATTSVAKEAVDKVLGKFFVRAGEVWRHERADEEIAKAAPRIEAAKTNGSKGGRKPSSKPTGKPTGKPNGHSQPVTHRVYIRNNPPGNPADNPTANPATNPLASPDGTQWASSPDPEALSITEQAQSVVPASARGVVAGARGEIGRALKAAGLNPTTFNLDDPRLLALLQQGATLAEFEGIAREAVNKGIKAPWGWVLKVLQERRAEAAEIALATTPPTREVWKPDPPLTPEQREASNRAREMALAAVKNITPKVPV